MSLSQILHLLVIAIPSLSCIISHELQTSIVKLPVEHQHQVIILGMAITATPGLNIPMDNTEPIDFFNLFSRRV
jgi:hypothetical protein